MRLQGSTTDAGTERCFNVASWFGPVGQWWPMSGKLPNLTNHTSLKPNRGGRSRCAGNSVEWKRRKTMKHTSTFMTFVNLAGVYYTFRFTLKSGYHSLTSWHTSYVLICVGLLFGSGPGILDPITTAASAGSCWLKGRLPKKDMNRRGNATPGLTWHFGVPTVRKVGSCMQQLFEGSVILGKVNFQLPLDAVSDWILGLLGNHKDLPNFPENLWSQIFKRPQLFFLLRKWDLQSLKCLDSSSSPFTVLFLGNLGCSGKFGVPSQQRRIRMDWNQSSIPNPSMSQLWEVVLGEETPQEGLYLENMLEPFPFQTLWRKTKSNSPSISTTLHLNLSTKNRRQFWGASFTFWLLQGC